MLLQIGHEGQFFRTTNLEKLMSQYKTETAAEIGATTYHDTNPSTCQSGPKLKKRNFFFVLFSFLPTNIPFNII